MKNPLRKKYIDYLVQGKGYRKYSFKEVNEMGIIALEEIALREKIKKFLSEGKGGVSYSDNEIETMGGIQLRQAVNINYLNNSIDFNNIDNYLKTIENEQLGKIKFDDEHKQEIEDVDLKTKTEYKTKETKETKVTYLDYVLFYMFLALPFIALIVFNYAPTWLFFISWIIAFIFGSKKTGTGHVWNYKMMSGYKEHTVGSSFIIIYYIVFVLIVLYLIFFE